MKTKTALKGIKIDHLAVNLDLAGLLKCRNIDTTRYDALGAELYQQFENIFNVAIVCVDKHKLINNEPYLVKIVIEDLTQEEYFKFQKKFESVIEADNKRYYNFNFSDVLMQSEVTINFISNGKFTA